MTPVINKPVPEFEALATNGVKFTPAAFHGQAVVLYFYPKDNTPGCTTEAMQFRDKYKDFVKAGAAVFGVSRDNMKSHDEFKAKLTVPAAGSYKYASRCTKDAINWTYCDRDGAGSNAALTFDLPQLGSLTVNP